MENVTASMNVMASLTMKYRTMFIASRERSKHKRRENKISVGLLLGAAEVAKVWLRPQIGI